MYILKLLLLIVVVDEKETEEIQSKVSLVSSSESNKQSIYSDRIILTSKAFTFYSFLL
jgi:hypothetical protein